MASSPCKHILALTIQLGSLDTFNKSRNFSTNLFYGLAQQSNRALLKSPWHAVEYSLGGVPSEYSGFIREHVIIFSYSEASTGLRLNHFNLFRIFEIMPRLDSAHFFKKSMIFDKTWHKKQLLRCLSAYPHDARVRLIGKPEPWFLISRCRHFNFHTCSSFNRSRFQVWHVQDFITSVSPFVGF